MTVRLSGLSSFLLFSQAMAARNNEIFKASEQLSTNKRLNRPSDDPGGMQLAMSFKQGLDKTNQYLRNIENADKTLQQTATVLTSVKDLLNQAHTLAVQGNNGTMDANSRVALANQIQQLQQELLSLSNSDINGQYIFNGYKTNSQPFSLDSDMPGGTPSNPVVTLAVQAALSTSLLAVQLDDNTTMTVQVRGDQTFLGDGTPATVNLFQTLENLEAALRSGDTVVTSPTGIPQAMDDLTAGIQQVVNQIAAIGAKQNRLVDSRTQLQNQRETLMSFVSDVEDVDAADAVLQFQKAQTALQATIGSAQAVLNLPSLMDFIGR